MCCKSLPYALHTIALHTLEAGLKKRASLTSQVILVLD